MRLTQTVPSEERREICGATELESMDSREVSTIDGIVETSEEHCLLLSPLVGPIHRRILHVNSYGGRLVWDRIKRGLIPNHQLLGCLQLVRMGYEVALAD